MSIPGHDFRWLADYVRSLHACRTYQELTDHTATAMQRRSQLIVASWETMSLDFTQYSRDAAVSAMPEKLLPHDVLFEAMADCPALQRVARGDRSLRIYLWEAGAALERTEFYNTMMRPYGCGEQVLNLLWGEGVVTVFNLGQERPFTDKERQLHALLYPHLVIALKRVERTRPRFPTLGDPWVSLRAHGAPARFSPAQSAVLRAYFPDWRPSTLRWPAAVASWLQTVRRAVKEDVVSNPPRALLVTAARGRLLLRYFPETEGRGPAVRLGEIPTKSNVVALGQRAGLTRRESEVFHWVVQGKRDVEIAGILGISTPTVSWHVHQLLVKIGVRSRSALVTASALD